MKDMIKSSRKARAMSRARKTFAGGRPRILRRCKGCGRKVSAREMRRPCPEHAL
jgi:hypothetical protein